MRRFMARLIAPTTPMGARLLRQWLSQPLSKTEPIRQRQDAVQTFIENSFGLDAFRQQLANVRDLERTLGRLSSGSGNARDLVALRMALEQIPALKEILVGVQASACSREDKLKLELKPAAITSLDRRSQFSNLRIARSRGINFTRHRGRTAAADQGRRHDPRRL